MEYNRAYFREKTAMVTGAASGIGLALVEELLQSGAAKVVMADINPELLQEHEARLQGEYGHRVKGLVCDVTAEENVQRMVDEAGKFFGLRFDLLFNNAGAAFGGVFDDMTNADWSTAFDLNFYSALYGMRAVLPIMIKQGGGQIINIISGIAFAPMAYQSRYAATKAALNALSLALRTEYWDDNIKISSATPGTTATGIWGTLEPPKTAQTARQSASRILHGAVNNDRLICGDDTDVEGAALCFSYAGREIMDQYLLRVARERRQGIVSI